MVTTLKRWHSTYMCWRGSIRLNTLQKWLTHRCLFTNFFWHLSNYTLLIYRLWTNVANWYKFSLRTSLFLFNSFLMFSLQVNPIINTMSFHNSEEHLSLNTLEVWRGHIQLTTCIKSTAVTVTQSLVAVVFYIQTPLPWLLKENILHYKYRHRCSFMSKWTISIVHRKIGDVK